MNKPIPNLRKLKHIEKAAQRDWTHRDKIRADGLRELGFYSTPFLLPWINPVRNLYGMLLQVNSKRRAAIFRLGRAALKQNALVKIQSLGTPTWLDLKKMDAAANFESEFKHGDLRKLNFSTPQQDKYDADREEIKQFIKNKLRGNPEAAWGTLISILNWIDNVTETHEFSEWK